MSGIIRSLQYWRGLGFTLVESLGRAKDAHPLAPATYFAIAAEFVRAEEAAGAAIRDNLHGGPIPDDAIPVNSQQKALYEYRVRVPKRKPGKR